MSELPLLSSAHNGETDTAKGATGRKDDVITAIMVDDEELQKVENQVARRSPSSCMRFIVVVLCGSFLALVVYLAVFGFINLIWQDAPYNLFNPNTTRTVNLTKRNGGYGLVLNVNKITEITPGGPADLQGEMKIGDFITSINGVMVHNIQEDAIPEVMNTRDNDVRLTVVAKEISYVRDYGKISLLSMMAASMFLICVCCPLRFRYEEIKRLREADIAKTKWEQEHINRTTSRKVVTDDSGTTTLSFQYKMVPAEVTEDLESINPKSTEPKGPLVKGIVVRYPVAQRCRAGARWKRTIRRVDVSRREKKGVSEQR